MSIIKRLRDLFSGGFDCSVVPITDPTPIQHSGTHFEITGITFNGCWWNGKPMTKEDVLGNIEDDDEGNLQ